MEIYQTEEQQIAVVKEFWKKHKGIILTFILVFLIVVFAKHIWHNYQAQNNANASSLYQDLLTAMQDNNLTKVKEKGEILAKKYTNSPYAALGGMILAKIAIVEQDMTTAMEKLHTVIANSKKTPLWYSAKLKLARLLFAKGELQAALTELEVPANGYSSLYAELQGDIYFKLSAFNKAKEAYQTAIAKAYGNPMPWLEMKLANIQTAAELANKGEINELTDKTSN